jgi:hypothetical protein
MEHSMAYSDDLEWKTFTIPASGYLSAAVALGSKRPVVIKCPTGTGSFTADTASLLFHGSYDGGTTYDVLRDKDGTAEYATVAANNTYGLMHLDPASFAGVQVLKIGAYQSDYATAVTQAAVRTIYVGVAKVTG